MVTPAIGVAVKITFSPSQNVSLIASDVSTGFTAAILVTVIELVAEEHARGLRVTESCNDLSYTLTSKVCTPVKAE